MEIRAGDEATRRLLQAAADGNVLYVSSTPDALVTNARCLSGCSALHWAAGSNQTEIIRYLITSSLLPADITATKKAKGRTPLHYACRNGCLAAAQLLIQMGANVNARAKHGVSPFQLAVWQNHLHICMWLVEEQGVDASQVNDFDCGAVHWIGICPTHAANRTKTENDDRDGRDLIPLAEWLARQPGVDFRQFQRQGHTPLHKAAWGGHIALLNYLRDKHGLIDDQTDYAGNYAADLADMANTTHHAKVARFLRDECSAARAKSCNILGVSIDASLEDIRLAYLNKARLYHPDRSLLRRRMNERDGFLGEVVKEEEGGCDFDRIRDAYEHLTFDNGVGKQCNPSHSIRLMIGLHASSQQHTNKDLENENNEEKKSQLFEYDKESKNDDDKNLFKARLIAVLLEYGDKGLALSNVKKKWRQVWPNEPFPDIKNGSKKKKGLLAEYILLNAGDVVEIRDGKEDGNECVVIPKHCTRDHVMSAFHQLRSD